MTAEFKENNALGWYAETDPDAVDDYPINWTDWLAANGYDVIAHSEWIVPLGVTRISDSYAGGDTTIWLGPCEVGEHRITNRVTTIGSEGIARRMDQSFTLIVKEA